MTATNEAIVPSGPVAAPTRLRWMEWPAVAGVWRHEFALFRRYWTSSSFASIVEPAIYLLAFGFGMGSLVGVVAGIPYIEFVGTGVVATSVLFVSAFGGMFNTFIRRTFQHTYDGMLAAPIDVHELVTGEASWVAARAGVYGCVPLCVAMLFGLDPSPGMLVVPFVGFITGFGFALFGVWISAIVPSINSIDYIISGLLTPLFLVAGTFFPLTALPSWAQYLAAVNPLYHCVELVRHAAFGFQPLADLGHVAGLLAFAALMWVLAVRFMRKQLID